MTKKWRWKQYSKEIWGLEASNPHACPRNSKVFQSGTRRKWMKTELFLCMIGEISKKFNFTGDEALEGRLTKSSSIRQGYLISNYFLAWRLKNIEKRKIPAIEFLPDWLRLQRSSLLLRFIYFFCSQFWRSWTFRCYLKPCSIVRNAVSKIKIFMA